MLVHSSKYGATALSLAARGGHVDAMRVLLGHPSANPAAMMLAPSSSGAIAFFLAAVGGHVDAMRLLLDHPSADPAAMMEVRSNRRSALVATAEFAADGNDGCPGHRCAPLLFLLRRLAADPQPSDAQRAHMNEVMEVLCMVSNEDEESEMDDNDEDGEGEKGEKKLALFDDDQPDDVRDESIRLLLEHGASAVPYNSPVMSRIIREVFAMARVPQRLNEAVLGVAIARQEDKPRGACFTPGVVCTHQKLVE
ncbi:hypothetical protein FOA52_007209 [Chlamydomonas sp. UWO 241]|nr:hypothetical protein FOA52_007209 [Chlamydomonas sp. UWO 241]